MLKTQKAVELVCADFIAVGTAGNKPEAVEIVRLTTGQHPDGSRWTVVNAKTKQGWPKRKNIKILRKEKLLR